jgi:hypothetical protein
MLTFVFLSACSDDDDGGTNPIQTDPLVATWISTGSNVAPLLNTIFASMGGIDTVYATFSSNKTYTVKQVNKNKTIINYAGTYTSTKSTVGNIYTIKLDQTAPAVSTSEGIYEITSTVTPNTMKYEVVQTSGTQFAPPTPAAGFGSTAGGTFGTTNIQNYVKK